MQWGSVRVALRCCQRPSSPSPESTTSSTPSGRQRTRAAGVGLTGPLPGPAGRASDRLLGSCMPTLPHDPLGVL